MICCHSTYFSVTKPIAKQIEDCALDNITGEKFGWWIIWRKHYKTRAMCNRRQIEGSGANDYNEDGDGVDDYEYDQVLADDDDIEEPLTPLKKTESSSTSTTTSHNTYGHPASADNNDNDDDDDQLTTLLSSYSSGSIVSHSVSVQEKEILAMRRKT